MMKKLNLGLGTDIREGWINLDRSALPGVNVVHDIEQQHERQRTRRDCVVMQTKG